MTTRLALLCVVVAASITILPAARAAAPEPFVTGGGWMGDPSDKVTFGLRLTCSPAEGPNSLQVSFGTGSNFHLLTVTSASCAVDPDEQENGGIYRGTGTGECNGQPAEARFIFRTAGMSNPDERSAAIEIASDDPSCDLFQAFQLIGEGNFRFHASG